MSKVNGTTGALLGIHAQTSLHPGAGSALGTVDLPVQRERHTKWPLIAGTALKGILRDACREERKGENDGCRKKANEEDRDLLAAFGPATTNADAHAGALSLTDARILAFPVRSLKGVFALVTCPAVLERLKRDASLAGISCDWDIAVPGENEAVVADDCPNMIDDGSLLLEEFDFLKIEGNSAKIAKWVVDNLLPAEEEYAPTRGRVSKSLVILNDNDFTHFVRHATEVTARIGLDYKTKTVKDGALFYQEFLPPETLFYSVVLANQARVKGGNGPDATGVMKILEVTLPSVLQVGGDETTGKGFCGTRLCKEGGN